MFQYEDAQIFRQPESFEKLDALGKTYFPPLRGMLDEARRLIWQVYGMDVAEQYKTSLDPTPTKKRRKDSEFKAERNTSNMVRVGLRAKGEPSSLLKSDRELAQMHFARLAFGIQYLDDAPGVAVGFEPYTLKYHETIRYRFADWIERLGLQRLLAQYQPVFNFKADTLADLMRKHGAVFSSGFIFAVEPLDSELAQLVVFFVAVFPFLDVFTRLSNGDDLVESDYVNRFEGWFYDSFDEYVNHFILKPAYSEPARVSEAQVRGYFERTLECEFPTLRPDWLVSDETGARLELDGYCEALRLAFEYQGEYHYEFVEVHHQERDLNDVQRIDNLKKMLCEMHNVDLIQVPYWHKDNPAYIVEGLRALHRPDINILLNCDEA